MKVIVYFIFLTLICWTNVSAFGLGNLAGSQSSDSSSNEEATIETNNELDNFYPDDQWLDNVTESDSRSLFKKVANDIKLDIYPGILRGSKNTMIASKGNSLDQSLLLSTLLKKQGHQVRITKGVLENTELDTLLKDYKAAHKHIPEMRKILSTHYWVEIKENGQWVALDPTYPEAEYGKAYAKEPSPLTTLPESLYQTLSISIIIETEQGNKMVLGSINKNIADIGYAPALLTLFKEPIIKKSTNPLGALAGATGNQKQVSMHYSGDLIYGKDKLTLKKYLHDDQDPSTAITSQYVEFEINAPGQKADITRRQLYSKNQDKTIADLRTYSMQVLPGNVSTTLLQQVKTVADSINIENSTIEKTLENADNIDELRPLNNQLSVATSSLLLTTFAEESDRLSLSAAKQGQLLLEFSKPRIYIMDTNVRYNEQKEGMINYHVDLRQDEVNVYPNATASIDTSYAYKTGRGMQQSFLEGLVLEKATGLTAITAATIINQAVNTGIELTTLYPGNISAEELNFQAELKPAVKEYITTALLDGKHIIIPTEPVVIDEIEQWGWWQLDPSDGHVIGVAGNALHAAMVEYNIIQSKVSANSNNGFVLGALTGSISTHTKIITEMIKDGEVTNEDRERMFEELKALACLSCFGGVSASASIGGSISIKLEECELAKISALEKLSNKKYINGEISFCKSYVKGFVCSSALILKGLQPQVQGAITATGTLKIGCDKYKYGSDVKS